MRAILVRHAVRWMLVRWMLVRLRVPIHRVVLCSLRFLQRCLTVDSMYSIRFCIVHFPPGRHPRWVDQCDGIETSCSTREERGERRAE